ncbi:976136e0-0624-4202-8277-5d4b26a2a752 [Thermothielavioides terrestris]|uniref:976136e0-0624-4202-8277-5d4b26a2a752 n=1 Tax=Thermothielavioides terrestris TaxID=2587410 RepID=A0A3S5CXK7_9PEZI|nr:976136e0-0624-4202-8277-5d4b26a2a752 [Thermothielavioides terrestris]
MVTEHYQQ